MAVDAGTDLEEALNRWQIDPARVRERMYHAPTRANGSAGTRCGQPCRAGPPCGWPWRWSAIRTRSARGWPPFAATAPPRSRFCTQVAPPALNAAQQAALKEAMQHPAREAGIALAAWHWKVVRRFVNERFGITLARSSCLTYLHRLGFVIKRPQKWLLKADEAKRAAFVTMYAALRAEAQASGAKHFFVDAAHFYADVDLHGTWVRKGTPALVDSSSPRYGEKARYYAAVCLETGEVEALPLTGNSSAQTSVAFLPQLRARHATPLVVFWDNAPAHGGDPVRDYLRAPALQLRLVCLPAYSPDFNADEYIWVWVRRGDGEHLPRHDRCCPGSRRSLFRGTRRPRGGGQAAVPHGVAEPR